MTIWNMEITASESPQTVHIPIEGKYYAIKNTGDHDILVSSCVASPTEGADDVMKIPSRSAAVIPVKDGDLYVSAEEDGTYSVSIQDDKVIPWGGGTGSGGGSGDNTHYKGTTTTALENGSTTNPITIVKDDESYTYTAVFGDVVVYGYTEFVFDGTAWSEFGRPFDTTPTRGSTNAVTSDGVYRNTAGRKYFVGEEARGAVLGSNYSKASGNGSLAEGFSTTASGSFSHSEGSGSIASNTYSHAEGQATTASGASSHSEGRSTVASGASSHAGGFYTIANKENSTAIGKYNVADTDVAHLLIVGNGTADARSNILEVSGSDMNVNGDIKINNVAIPTPYTTMPTITESMLGKIAMYVGATNNNYVQGCFYTASTDGAAEPTYSWVKIVGTLGLEEVVLWENDGTTNPDTITLSEPITNFDEFIIEAIYRNSSGGRYRYSNTWQASTDLIGMSLQLNDEEHYVACTLTTSTTFTSISTTSRPVVFTKIIGRRYTKVRPTDLGALAYKDTASGSYTPAGSVSVAQSPATYVYDGTTGITTYTEAGAPSATFTGTTENITVG